MKKEIRIQEIQGFVALHGASEFRNSLDLRHSGFVIIRNALAGQKSVPRDRPTIFQVVLPFSPDPRYHRWLRPGNLLWLPYIGLLPRAYPAAYKRTNNRRRHCV